jgi:hypothetical protein
MPSFYRNNVPASADSIDIPLLLLKHWVPKGPDRPNIDIPPLVTSNKAVKRAPLSSKWFDKRYLAVGLVVLALLSLTTVYRPRPVHRDRQHAVKTLTAPTHQRTLKSTNFETAAPTPVYSHLPAPTFVRQPIHADRSLSPRRLPGSYYNRPPPALLS